tara:strand:- start:3521 stop:3706 length:186 start_codon:yes stop_codon:yes gene_type:complete
MKNKLFYFVYFDELTQRSETLEVQAKTFAEALPAAHVYRVDLNKKHIKSSWDVIKVNSKLA